MVPGSLVLIEGWVGWFAGRLVAPPKEEFVRSFVLLGSIDKLRTMSPIYGLQGGAKVRAGPLPDGHGSVAEMVVPGK